MPSRMDKYSKNNIRKRTEKNSELYRTMYDDVSYSNIEEISVIEKNEKVDIDKIKELINGTNNVNKPKSIAKSEPEPLKEEIEEQKNYDIMDVLDKAKSKRNDVDNRYLNTKYNILTNDELRKELESNQEKIKEAISESDATLDLLDDLKSICDSNLKDDIKKQDEIITMDENMDKSFYTSSTGFSKEDFDEEIPEKNDSNVLTIVLIIILTIVIIGGIIFLYLHFK